MKSNKLKCWLAAVVVAVICCPVALAQQSKIAVASFNRMETDITARVTAPKKDQNGEVCALIRIVTNVKDLMFEPDALGITARENKIGESGFTFPVAHVVSLSCMTSWVSCETTSIRTSLKKAPYTKWC